MDNANLGEELPLKKPSDLIERPSLQPAPHEKKNRTPGKCPIYFEKKENENGVNISLSATKEEDNKKNANDFYNELLEKMTGTNDVELATEILNKASLCIHGHNEAGQKNVILQSLADQQPRDAHEARLCSQATVLYSQAMKYLKRAEGALDDDVFDKQGWNQIFMRNATRLLDLHTKTVETLIRYRQRGEQKIVVQHINLNDNAKAIVSGQMLAGEGVKIKTNEVIP